MERQQLVRIGRRVNNTVDEIAVSGSNVYVGGNFSTAGSVAASRIANGMAAAGLRWAAVSLGIDRGVWHCISAMMSTSEACSAAPVAFRQIISPNGTVAVVQRWAAASLETHLLSRDRYKWQRVYVGGRFSNLAA